MRIAVVGSGIAGMVAAYVLSREHRVQVFEAASTMGGHTHTVTVGWEGRSYDVDTGFIVFNDRTYPNFIKLLDRLGVASKPSSMSFSVRCERSGLEYCSTSLNTLFAQRRNLLRPSFYGMLAEILRFNRESKAALYNGDEHTSLQAYLEREGYSRNFVDHYIIPMGASIWSADPAGFGDFSLRFFVQFFDNHGMLSVRGRPQWRVITGGSKQYIGPLTSPYREDIRLNCPVEAVQRRCDHVEIKAGDAPAERFDAVVIACHSDQALRLLADASEDEQAILSCIPYQKNEAVLHTDRSLLPRRRRAWASWNYHVLPDPQRCVAMTYNMNILQGLDAAVQFCVTLNRTADIRPDRIIKKMTYHHPVFTTRAVQAQRQHGRINGVNRTFFCGAYWGYGFHEDGVNSALAACKPLQTSVLL